MEDELKGKGSQKICDQMKAKDGAAIEEGMKMLQTAIDKRQDYDDAMAYMNLLYRRKANDMTCDDAAETRAEYVKTANEWSDKAMAARKKKAEEASKKTSGGIVLDQPKSQQQPQPK